MEHKGWERNWRDGMVEWNARDGNNNKHEKQWWYGKNKTIKQFEFIFKHLFLNFAQNEKGKRREKRCEKNILFTFE